MRKQKTDTLTAREIEIIQCAMLGLRPKQIAQHLGISPFTVHTHVRNIYKVLGANSMAHAVAIYLGTGPASP